MLKMYNQTSWGTTHMGHNKWDGIFELQKVFYMPYEHDM